jgi:hypothetical protein
MILAPAKSPPPRLARAIVRRTRGLVLGYYSVHTSPDALRDAEAHISSIQKRLVQEGRL